MMTPRVFFRTALSAVLAALAMASAAQAQSAEARLQSVLARAPQAMFAPQGTIVAGYGNGDALRWIAVRGAQAGRNPNTPNRFAALRSAAPNQQAIIAAQEDASLRSAVGLTALDWVETWEVAQGPVRMGAMDIFPDSEMRLRGALFSNGFEQQDRAGLTVLWQGEEDYTPDPAWRDPANPFGGDMGLPLRFAFNGDRALWATGWPALEQVLQPTGPNLAARADAQALANGLRRAGNLGQVVSVRAWLRNGAEVPVAGAQTGPVEGLALVDYANRETEAAALVLAFAPDMQTEALAGRLAEAWPILSMLPSPATPEISAGNGSITITLRSDWGEDAAASNASYEVLRDVLASGRLGLLLSR